MQIKQVETNTIASSFSVMASKVTALHKWVEHCHQVNMFETQVLKSTIKLQITLQLYVDDCYVVCFSGM